MVAFQLDTSGCVPFDHPRNDDAARVWQDLTPFCQGYVEAMKQAHRLLKEIRPASGGDGVCYFDWRFSDLAPATVERIIGDCETYVAAQGPRRYDFEQYAHMGRNFWRSTARPPLTPYLGDDGLIYLREAA